MNSYRTAMTGTRSERKAALKAIRTSPEAQARKAAIGGNRHVRKAKAGVAWAALLMFLLVCWAAWQGVL